MSWLDNLTQDASQNEATYRPTIEATENLNNIPSGVLSRLLYQESRYRTDIITGATRSSVGAIGIAQFMPATAKSLGVNPLDPESAIKGAGRYLAQLYRQFGDWKLAIMAYNWGSGNVTAYVKTGKGAHGQDVPTESSDYVAQIASDVGLA